MGFSPGQVVEVVQNTPGVPLLLRVRDGKMALDKRTAMQIIVRRILK
jgi:ferrous iron transport protein A